MREECPHGSELEAPGASLAEESRAGEGHGQPHRWRLAGWIRSPLLRASSLSPLPVSRFDRLSLRFGGVPAQNARGAERDPAARLAGPALEVVERIAMRLIEQPAPIRLLPGRHEPDDLRRPLIGPDAGRAQ